MSEYLKNSKQKQNVVSQILGIREKSPPKLTRKPASVPTSVPTKTPTRKAVSAPAKIQTRAHAKAPTNAMILRLPTDIRNNIIGEYMDKLPSGYKLRDWIPVEKLLWRPLSENENAMNMIEERLEIDKDMSEEQYRINYLINNDERFIPPGEYNTVHWGSLSINKNAIDLIKKKIIDEDNLSPEEYNRLRENDRLDWAAIGLNSNPKAMELLKKKPSKIEWFTLCEQKNAMTFFINNKFKEEKLIMSRDPNRLFDMHGTKKLDWRMLSSNTAAIDIIKEHLHFEDTLPLEKYNYLDSGDKVDWWRLAANSKAMPLIKWLIDNYLQYENVVDDETNPLSRYTQHFDGLWRNLSKNPSAAKYLYENYPERIQWQPFSENTSEDAIKYLAERVELEKTMNLNTERNKIDWGNLSKNPNAFDILFANQDKIHWDKLCCNTNPKVMELIKNKFSQEPDTDTDEWVMMRAHEKLYWYGLSQNPAIFVKKYGRGKTGKS
jgi:hypothetical protein